MITLSKEDVFKGQTTDMFRVLLPIYTSNRLLDLLIQFTEKSRSAKCHFNVIMERENVT